MFFDFLPKHLMFPQVICSIRLDTPCLQQSRKKKTRYSCLDFGKKILQGASADVFTRPTLLGYGVPCKRAQHCCATLRRSQNNGNVGTCWAKSLTCFKLYATSANIALVPCKWAQQCWVLLADNVASVGMGLKINEDCQS